MIKSTIIIAHQKYTRKIPEIILQEVLLCPHFVNIERSLPLIRKDIASAIFLAKIFVIAFTGSLKSSIQSHNIIDHIANGKMVTKPPILIIIFVIAFMS